MINKRSKPKKIAIVVNSLAKGGAERSNSLVSQMCAEEGFDVVIISILDKVDFEHGGEFISLGNQNNKNIILKKWSKAKHALQVFKTQKFDLVIDARSRPTFWKELFIQKVIYKGIPKIYLVRSYKVTTYVSSWKKLAEFLYKKQLLITVSKEMKHKLLTDYNLNKVKNIYNAYDKEIVKANQAINTGGVPYILFYGRLDNESKNLFFLLESYSLSKLSKLGVELYILGDGPDKLVLKEEVIRLGIDDKVKFTSFTTDPFSYVINSLFVVMTSHYEGFPRTILESMSIGTPVVSLNFKSGPSEIIVTGENGILVEENTVTAFAEALNKMVVDVEFYAKCKEGTKESVKFFEKKYIAKEWKKLIETI